jgi:hypothetical protein
MLYSEPNYFASGAAVAVVSAFTAVSATGAVASLTVVVSVASVLLAFELQANIESIPAIISSCANLFISLKIKSLRFEGLKITMQKYTILVSIVHKTQNKFSVSLFIRKISTKTYTMLR